jgi:hypothetical protein
LLAGSLVALVTLVAAGRAQADPCAPTAVLQGEIDVVDAVQQTLAGHGVGTIPTQGCPFVNARLTRCEGGLQVQVADADGRTSERVVATPAVAAALVESWTRSDIGAELLAPTLVGGLGTPGAGFASVETGESVEVADDREAWSGWLGLTGEVPVGSDRSTWFGARVGLCGRMGPACVGVLARFAYDSGLSGNSEELQTQRMGADGLFLLDFPLEWPSVHLVPGIGIGGGWARSSRYIEPEDEEEEEEDQDRNEVHGQIDNDRGGLRVDAHLLLAIMLTRGLSLDIAASVGLSAMGYYGAYNYDDARVAGEPRAFFRAGAGLGYRF